MLQLIRKFNSKRTLPLQFNVDDFGIVWIPVYAKLDGIEYYFQKIEKDFWGRWVEQLEWCTTLPKWPRA